MKCEGGSYFYENKKYRSLETEKKKNQLFQFRNFEFFIYPFFQKMLNVSSESAWARFSIECVTDFIT